MPTDHLFERFYYSKPGWTGGTEPFHALCKQYAKSRGSILEIGCGPSNPTSEYLANLGVLYGIDITDEVHQNFFLTQGKVFDGRSIPFPDESFDLCVSDWVLEHVEHPEEHFREVKRVLKPGGRYCFRTMNLWHYVSLASRMLPHSAHLLLSRRLRGAPDMHEPYPTYYRANTKRRLTALAKQAGMRVDLLDRLEVEPSYGRASTMLFYPMMAYERIVNSSEALSFLRVTFLGVLARS
jgi:SAM-dependent methyltransferase